MNCHSCAIANIVQLWQFFFKNFYSRIVCWYFSLVFLRRDSLAFVMQVILVDIWLIENY